MAAGYSIIIVGECAAQSRGYSEQREVIPRNQLAVRDLRRSSTGDANLEWEAAQNTAEHLVSITDVAVQRVRQSNLIVAHVAGIPFAAPLQTDELRGVLHRQPAQQHLIEEAEDSGVGSDTKS